MVEKIIVGLLISIVSALFVFTFITNRSRVQIIKDANGIVNEAIKTHLSIEHQLTMHAIVKEHVDSCQAPTNFIEVQTKLEQHIQACPAPKNIQELQNQLNIIKISLVFLVRNAGGNPDDLGLRL